MKRIFTLVLALLLFLPFFLGFSEEEIPALYHRRENGIWGYTNRAGEAVTEPELALVLLLCMW